LLARRAGGKAGNVRRRWARFWPIWTVTAAGLAIAVTALVVDRLSRGEYYPRTNYSRIEEDLYLGGILEEPPPGTRAVLNVCETEDPYRAEVHRWDPIPDRAPAPGIAWLRRQVQFVAEQRRAGRPVFVHCRAGLSRGAMVVTAYLMWRDHCTRDEALAVIRTSRPSARPNPAFMRLLLEWEEIVSRTGD
jgi:hypothetical protein